MIITTASDYQEEIEKNLTSNKELLEEIDGILFPVGMMFEKDTTNLEIQKIHELSHVNFSSIAFIINNKLAYASDINGIQNKYHKYFKNLKFLVIDCLRIKKHPSHYNLFEVLELIKF